MQSHILHPLSMFIHPDLSRTFSTLPANTPRKKKPPTKIKNSVINSGVAEAQKKKKNKERKKKNETTLPTFQPQVRMEGLPLQAVQAQRPSQSRPRA